MLLARRLLVSFRTTYAADSLFGGFVELLASSRPDCNDDGSDLLSGIVEDPEDAAEFPVPSAGTIERAWIRGRMVGNANLNGRYVDVRHSATIAALRPKYIDLALSLGFDDFDAAALKAAYPRRLTHELTVDFNNMTATKRGTLRGWRPVRFEAWRRPRNVEQRDDSPRRRKRPDLQRSLEHHGLTLRG